jgi:hypothetical protein
VKKDPTERMNEVRDNVEVLASSLSARIDPRAVGGESLMPFKVLVRREALAWRFVDLSRGAVVNYKEKNLASTAVLTRAALETTAALYHLHARVKSVVDSGAVGDIGTYLKRVLLGNKTMGNRRDPINVMTFVQKLDKKYDGVLHQYDELCEFAHPNWAGTLGLYHTVDARNRWVDFGKKQSTLHSVGGICAVNLDVAERIFEGFYAEIPDMMPRFIEVCERDTARDPRRSMPPQ